MDFTLAVANTVPTNFTFIPTDTVTINESGFYRIDYTITGSSEDDTLEDFGLAYAIFIDGTIAPGTNYGTFIAGLVPTINYGLELKGTAIISVVAPADITLQNIGATTDILSVTVDNQPIVNASLLVQRIT